MACKVIRKKAYKCFFVFWEFTKWLVSNQHAETWVFLGDRNHLTIIIPHSDVGCKVINNQRGAQFQVSNTSFHLTCNHHLVITTWYLISGIIVLLNSQPQLLLLIFFLDKPFALRRNSWMPGALDIAKNRVTSVYDHLVLLEDTQYGNLWLDQS